MPERFVRLQQVPAVTIVVVVSRAPNALVRFFSYIDFHDPSKSSADLCVAVARLAFAEYDARPRQIEFIRTR
jgi:hypothetical protein